MHVELYEQSAEREILPDHHPELDDLCFTEVLSRLRHEGWVYLLPVRRERLRPADRDRLSRLEGALLRGFVDLRDRLFVEALTRRRRVPCEQSGVAAVERRHLEPRQLFDP